MSGKKVRTTKDSKVEENNKRKAGLDVTESPPKKRANVQQSNLSRPEQTKYDQSISKLDPTGLSGYIAKATERFSNESSTIELEDKLVPVIAFANTTSFSEPRVSVHLSTFLERFGGGKQELTSCNSLSQPHTLVIAPSAIRATDLIRELRVFGTESNKIAKLFAKHMKLKDSITYVQKTQFGIGVGTPTRMLELLERDTIHVQDLLRIVIDGSYIDDKQRTIFDMKEVFLPLLAILNTDSIAERLRRGEAKILVF